MKKSPVAISILIVAATALSPVSCSKTTVKNNGTPADRDISMESVDIEKKYLAEGFISSDRFRVVIISTKDPGANDMEEIKNKASRRARVSIEQNLTNSDIPCDRNTKVEIVNLIKRNGELSKKDIEHSRYNVYYFDVTKKNMKNYLKNIALQK